MFVSLKRPFALGRGRRGSDIALRATIVFLALIAATAAAFWGLLSFPPANPGQPLTEYPIPVGPWTMSWSPTAEGPDIEQSAQLGVVLSVISLASALVSILGVTIGLLLWRQRIELDHERYFVRRAVGARSDQILAEVAGEGGSSFAVIVAGLMSIAIVLPRLISHTFPGDAHLGWGYGLALVPTAGLIVWICRLEVRAANIPMSNRRSRFGDILSPLTVVLVIGFMALSGTLLLVKHPPVEESPSATKAVVVQGADVSAYDPGERGAVIEEWQRRAASRGISLGVASAGTSRGTGMRDLLTVECGQCSRGGLWLPLQAVRTEFHAVAPDTFSKLDRTVVQGRDFSWRLDGGASGLAIVNQTLARERFERGEAVGRKVSFNHSDWMTVIGVVSDRAHSRHLTEYEVFLPVGQAAPADIELVFESSSGDPSPTMVTAPERASVDAARTLLDLFEAYHWARVVLSLLALIAVVLVCVGCSITARREAESMLFECGVRKAIGARRPDLVRYFAARICMRLVVGFGLGAWLSLFLGIGLHRAPGAVPQLDLSIWGLVALLMTGTVTIASIPSCVAAIRASPGKALRARA